MNYHRLLQIADLDYDGRVDTILAYFYTLGNMSPNAMLTHLTLVVGGKSILAEAEGYKPQLDIVDIDSTDRIKEIAILDGISDSPNTSYFALVSGSLQYVGEVEGSNSGHPEISYPADGTIHTERRGTILHTWWYLATYQLTQQHRIMFVAQPFYSMNAEVTIAETLALCASPTDPTVTLVVRPGTRATIDSTDDQKWLLVRTKDGRSGWVSVGADGRRYFEGLVFAD